MTTPKTSFTRVDYTLADLLTYIEMGDVGLPDIQRPFVWTAAKVRDLLDSMYRGFPVGYLLFWKTPSDVGGAKQIGTAEKQHKVPGLLIVDGQQRLTSLYAVFRGRAVLDSDYRETRIEVAFRPRDARFEVTDAAIRKDPEFIADVSQVWRSSQTSYGMVKNFIKQLVAAKGELSASEEDAICRNLDGLFDLKGYPFTALEIMPNVSEEEVSDIFVRINSQGVKLNQADFILTLLSVFWEEGRKELETFCRRAKRPAAPGEGPSPFNHFIKPSPDQLLRVSVALGFERGRLKSVYQVLRGKDVETDSYIPEKRDAQFSILKVAQAEVLKLSHWHQFLNALVGAGYRGWEMISSNNALLYAYAFYLIGKTRHGVPEHVLQKVIGRWFFVSHLVGRYTNSPETAMDADLNRLKGVGDGKDFVVALDRIMGDSMTEDYWSITLPNDLESSAARSPALFSYYAALMLLDAPILFSTKKVAALFDPAIQSPRKSLERHHLFPRAWLERQGYTDMKQINQQANFAPLEWPDNQAISDAPPAEYVPKMRARFTAQEFARMQALHGLPDGWETMEYETFLTERRRLMAQLIRSGYEQLA